MEIIVIKKATKTKLERKYFYNLFEEISKTPSHYIIEYNCNCGEVIKSSIGNWRKRKHNLLCHSCAIKEEWTEGSYKEKHSEGIKRTLSTVDGKQRRSETQKNNWKKKEYRTKTLAAIKISHTNPEYNLKLRVGQKKRWEDESFREKYFKMIHSSEYKEKQRLGIEKKWQDKVWVEKELTRQSRKFSQINYKGLFCRSFAEYTFIKLIESRYNKIESCNFVIPYIDKTGKPRNYCPDFKLTLNGQISIIEVKGAFLRDLKDLDLNSKQGHRYCSLDKVTLNLKLKALKKYCSENNYTYELVTFDNKEFRKLYIELKKQQRDENNKN